MALAWQALGDIEGGGGLGGASVEGDDDVGLEFGSPTVPGPTPVLPPKPEIRIAREAARARLARQGLAGEKPGELYDLTCDLMDFDDFGTDISQYMSYLYVWTRAFLLCFLLNLSNIVLNIEGNGVLPSHASPLHARPRCPGDSPGDPPLCLATMGWVELSGVDDRLAANPAARARPSPPSGAPPRMTRLVEGLS